MQEKSKVESIVSRVSYDKHSTNGWREGIWYKNISFTYLNSLGRRSGLINHDLPFPVTPELEATF